ncbi:LPS export ABC transporter periplasmic protein LptC [Sandaracinobacter sp. RS1-74]|uniref:LPS export ABC transporter periplasmic protein LptC n=1 Tax=Sandaracinobacteroides sayramensis TaxID=2913411 RepID=UPI001ED9DF7A|nr:LPS export ABC transporter periplasmic protein LptC [Sandaracinobacteroides sayramensis]MCG2840013.1 LPS export ABC transporter periplasmic protein LptC [Sandaracinobacteroides sayramensis]
MSERADREREARRRSMLPGGPRDAFVAVAKWGFPVASTILFAILVVLPLSATQEFSFLLSKDSAAHAGERMRMQEATYRGETAKGESFEIVAQSGVQKTSAVPVVVMTGLSARLDQQQGPAIVTAPSGEFFIDQNRLLVNGPVEARSASGYSLDGHAIQVDMNSNRVSTQEPVSGTLPMGKFQANAFAADMEGRTVSMTGGVKLRITPNRTAR